MIKQLLAAIGVFVIVGILGIVFSQTMKKSESGVKVKIGLAVFNVEVVSDPVSQARGLSGRESLPEENGMLFVFPKLDIQKFWMKDMKFPIDIIWIQGSKVIGTIIGVEPPVVSGVEPDYEIYSSPEPADKVLEINAGQAQLLGIKVGDTVELK